MDISNSKAKLRYRPLVSRTAIWLVMIHPGSRCHLLHTKLSEMDYDISYEWKDESDDDPTINLNGKDVIVRKNLHDALVQIRLSEAEQHTWIDALSINQFEIKERNAQIEIMGQIYSGASIVIVWLGNTAENSDTACKMLEEMAAQTVLETTDK
ncbi:hypothetical protein BOTCAL_0003g00560 [Botryotinia calthae]|uniref:Heterokaryon incompatibility domain-containing protein n=1 Tax=Botryotinia calthae TaxID=38488 RepID=A0A4Y8DHY1_9HELO|nr:hypothetical protein BOTCAL_0003g00560 [Botryotinia calthae]